MKCPHCRETFHETWRFAFVEGDETWCWATQSQICPACKKPVIFLVYGNPGWARPHGSVPNEVRSLSNAMHRRLVYPKASVRPCPGEVPVDIAEDYNEACAVLADSPKAAAALARRCLQAVLRDAAGTKARDLADQIQEVLDSGKLRSDLASDIDSIRAAGNFATHPMKSQHSGEIVPVEPNEAEWTLDVLDGLFDFYYVQPAISKARRDAMNAKLAAAGKPPMKVGGP